MNSGRLIKKSGIYFVGTLSSKILSALLIPIYAFYINSEDLGTYTFSQTIMGILSPIIFVAIWEAILKFVISESDVIVREKKIVTSSLFSIAMTLLALVIFVLLKIFFIFEIKYYYLTAFMILLNGLAVVWQYYARSFEENKLYVKAGVLSTIVNFGCIIIFVIFFNWGLLGLLLSYIIGQIAIIFTIEIKLKVLDKISVAKFDIEILKKMLAFSSPLVLNLISSWFISGFGRIFITWKLGVEANGLYSFANNFSLIVTMMGNVIIMAIIEEAILSIKSSYDNSGFENTLQSLSIIFIEIAILMTPSIVIFYNLISNTEYNKSLIFAPGLLLYAIVSIMASNVGSLFQAIEKTKFQFITTIFGGIITFVISWFFIDSIGVFAVIVGQVLGATTMLFSRYFIVNKYIEVKINWVLIFKLILFYISITFICLRSNLIVNIVSELTLIIVAAYKYRKIISRVYHKLVNIS